MKHLKNFALILSLLAMLPTAYGNDIWEDSSNIKDKTNAKIMRYLAQQRALEASMTKEEKAQLKEKQKNNSSCGSVDIGNVSGSKSDKIETVVIIRGDVINANNNCK